MGLYPRHKPSLQSVRDRDGKNRTNCLVALAKFQTRNQFEYIKPYKISLKIPTDGANFYEKIKAH